MFKLNARMCVFFANIELFYQTKDGFRHTFLKDDLLNFFHIIHVIFKNIRKKYVYVIKRYTYVYASVPSLQLPKSIIGIPYFVLIIYQLQKVEMFYLNTLGDTLLSLTQYKLRADRENFLLRKKSSLLLKVSSQRY